MFADIPGYDGFYRVSDKGVVQTCRTPGREKNKKGQWRTLSASSGRAGHLVVVLHKDNKPKSYYVHRLVLEAFVGPCPDGMEARHYPDRNPANNDLSNLSWATYQVNQNDRARHGTSNRGERCAAAKLKKRNVPKIKNLYSSGKWSMRRLSELFGVSLSSVHAVVHGKTWSKE